MLCEDIVRFMKMKAKPGVEVLFDRHLPECRIVSDRNRLNQVIANFVNNAIKFTTAGSIRVGYNKVDETHLRFYVADTGLGIEPELHYAQMADLTGSQKVKVLLARALFGNPDILLLDEPTNHLDLDAIEWLEEFLINFENTVIVVSHDRDFLDGLVSKVYEFGNQKVTEHLEGIYEFMQRKKMENLRELERKN